MIDFTRDELENIWERTKGNLVDCRFVQDETGAHNVLYQEFVAQEAAYYRDNKVTLLNDNYNEVVLSAVNKVRGDAGIFEISLA